MQTTNHTITVTYDDGRLIARCCTSQTLSSGVVRGCPITPSTDSHAVAQAVCEINGAEILAVDHDGDTIYVLVSGEVCD